MVLRFATGVTLAGVYPPGMKLMASWTDRDRGLGIGILVGALTVGSAMPHLLGALSVFGGDNGIPPWRSVLLAASAFALIAALIAAVFVRPGPLLAKSAPFDWRYAGHALSDRPVRLANFGYLGHMWELYAMLALLQDLVPDRQLRPGRLAVPRGCALRRIRLSSPSVASAPSWPASTPNASAGP